MAKTAIEPGIRRYTNLASAIHVLRHRELTLLSPSTWDDRNDAFFLSAYRRRSGAKTVLALCFSQADETYHHWRVFSHGSDGVCIEFDRDELAMAVDQTEGMTFQPVVYRTIDEASESGVALDELPFIKRYPYRDELEQRLIYVEHEAEYDAVALEIQLSAIRRITLSPWMAKPLAEAVKQTLREIKGCSGLKVYHSKLIEYERWKRLADPDLR